MLSTCWMRGPASCQTSDHTTEAGLPSAHGYFVPSVSRRYASLQKKVSSGPQAIHIEKREVMSIRTTVCRLRGHALSGPSGVAAQSTARRSRPISPLRCSTSRMRCPRLPTGTVPALGPPPPQSLGT